MLLFVFIRDAQTNAAAVWKLTNRQLTLIMHVSDAYKLLLFILQETATEQTFRILSFTVFNLFEYLPFTNKEGEYATKIQPVSCLSWVSVR